MRNLQISYTTGYLWMFVFLNNLILLFIECIMLLWMFKIYRDLFLVQQHLFSLACYKRHKLLSPSIAIIFKLLSTFFIIFFEESPIINISRCFQWLHLLPSNYLLFLFFFSLKVWKIYKALNYIFHNLWVL